LSMMSREELMTAARYRRTEALRLITLVRGDLDWIVMRCLEKDRARRYETANGLAMDLQRYLDQEPVVARPQSTLYRFQKLIRRNRLAFAAAASVGAALLLGVVVSTCQAVRARQAEREQSRLRDQAQKAQIREEQLRRQAEADEHVARQEAYASD